MIIVLIIVINYISIIVPDIDSSCTNGEVRLTSGRVPSEGVIEVCVNGVWGAVCGTGWDQEDAGVVCGQLGYHDNHSKHQLISDDTK